MGRFSSHTDFFTEGRRNQALENRVGLLEDERQAQTANLVTAPEPCTPDFAIAYTFLKRHLRATFCSNVPTNIARLKTVIIKDSDVVDQVSYDTLRLNDETDVDDDSAAAGHFEYQFGPGLEANTLYRLVRMVGIDSNGNRQITEAPLYTDTPVATFTTPNDPGVGQAGGPNLIIGGGMMNSLAQFETLAGITPSAGDIDLLGSRWETGVNSGTRIDRTLIGSWASDGLQWADNIAVLKHASDMFSLGGQPSTRIQKRIIAGETYTFSCLIACEDALQEQHIIVALADQGVGDIIAAATPANWLFSIVPSWDLLVAILRVPTDYDQVAKQWVTMRITGDLSGGNNWFTTKWKLERGENVSPWMPHQGDEDQLDSQTAITAANAQGHGSFGQETGGIYDAEGTIFGGPSGITIGKFKRS